MDLKRIATLAAASVALAASAVNYVTRGDGTTYTFRSLSEIGGAPVMRLSDSVFAVSDTLVIAAGDTFRLEGDERVRCATGFVMEVQGDADFIGEWGQADEGGEPFRKAAFYGDPNEYWTRDGVTHEPQPYEIRVNGESAVVAFRNLTIQALGIAIYHAKEVSIDSCVITRHNGVSQRAAVSLAGAGMDVRIAHSAFSQCRRSAVGSAANAYNDLTISGCDFQGNSLSNENIPQVNVTAGPSVLISGNRVVGDATLTNVGGIGVGNLMMATDPFFVQVEDNVVSGNRYGLTFTGPMAGLVRRNTITDNRSAADAMTGGSGISLYYTGSANTVRLRDNDIERNLWGITLLGNSYYGGNRVDMGTEEAPGNNTLRDNGNGGTLYALYNNQADSVWAVGNRWLDAAADDPAAIAAVIFDQSDDPRLGPVVFMPAGATAGIARPGIAATGQGGTADGVFDLSGRRVSPAKRPFGGLPRGVYVVRQGGMASKVLMGE